MKQTSVGLLLTDGSVFLVCHSTGNKFFDIPKGLKEENESPLATCIREVREETNLDVSGENLIDLGLFEYTPKKDLHLFLLVKEMLPNTNELECHSFFVNRYTGEELPEVDGFEYIRFEEQQRFLTKNMAKVMEKVRKAITRTT